MNKAIFKYFSLVLVITLLFSSLVSMVILSDQILDNTKEDMVYAIRLIEHDIDYNEELLPQVEELNKLAYTSNTRLTIIDLEGDVLADSDKTSISENHAKRTEVKEAISNGSGYATRYSTTIKKNLLYVALRDGGHIIRLSIPYYGFFDTAGSLIEPLFISSLLSLCIAMFLSYRFSKTLTRPLEDISKEVSKIRDNKYLSFGNYQYDEFNIIATKLKEQAETIQDTMNTLKKERIKINGILNQMNEGFILLDTDHNILMFNNKINELFGDKVSLNKSIKDYIFDYKIIEGLDRLGNVPTVVDVTKNEIVYRCFISSVDYGITLLFIDVTQQVKAVKMRTEFFSNVSHELKTPMTSIRGYSELLQAGVIDNPDGRKQALDKIQKEVDNMSNLINDILMISRLENKDIEVVKVPMHVKPIVDEILDSLKVEADKKELTITTEIEDIAYASNHQHMHQLLNNLIINAVKYNKVGGSIDINCYQMDHDFIIEVSDTGKGISLLDQGRVFERFFRCDSGRDKETGGTGLGLAIVKHIVQYYQGNIQLTSELDKGTTFKIILPITNSD